MTDITWTDCVVKLGSLKPWGDNPKTSSKKDARALLKSWNELGQFQTIAIGPDGEVYDGHQRLSALLVVNGAAYEIAARRSSRPLTDEERRKVAIYSRQIGAWDWDKLSSWQPAELMEWGFDADLLKDWKRDTAALDNFLKSEQPEPQDAEPQVDRAAELNEKWQVKTGDLWRIGEHRLLCGDSTRREDVERVMGGERAQAVITDPPYGQNQDGVTNDEPEKLHSILLGCVQNLPIDNGIIIAFSSPRTFPEWLDISRENGYKFERMLWLYKAAQETFPWRGWLLTSEAILVTSRGIGEWQDVRPYSHDCYYKSEVSGQLAPDAGWHGSVKPLDVVKDLTARTSEESAIIYEPFAGSGTTLVACQNLSRKCRAIEISPNYCAVILERMAQAFPGIEIERIKSNVIQEN